MRRVLQLSQTCRLLKTVPIMHNVMPTCRCCQLVQQCEHRVHLEPSLSMLAGHR
jgi:predicted RecB family nuclease